MKVTQNSLIFDVYKEKPQSKKVIEKYFAGACFSCPSFLMETIAEGAFRHGLDPEVVVNEINEL